jgi:hypothetical protein
VLSAIELEQSLDRAVWHYLDYLWQQRHALAVVHPWFVDAYRQLTHLIDETGTGSGVPAQTT